MEASKSLLKNESMYAQAYESKINVFGLDDQLNLDLFEKLAISMKIASGTFNLNRPL